MKSILAFLLISFAGFSHAKNCTYTTYQWNVESRKAVNFRQVQKPYTSLTRDEIDLRTGCSVCLEDQVDIQIEGIPTFKLCKAIAYQVKQSIVEAIAEGMLIDKVVGYRVGMTKGKVDDENNRTQFSNHSFGTAVDINPDFNGLYDNCVEFSPSCRLIKGGEYQPFNRKGITPNSPIVESMNKLGFHWGGVILGNQKDFMHFSFSGY